MNATPAMPDRWHNYIDGVKCEIRYTQQPNQAPRFEVRLNGDLIGEFSSISAASVFVKKELKKRKKPIEGFEKTFKGKK